MSQSWKVYGPEDRDQPVEKRSAIGTIYGAGTTRGAYLEACEWLSGKGDLRVDDQIIPLVNRPSLEHLEQLFGSELDKM